MTVQQQALADIETYTVTARIIHWITAAIVLSMIPIGFIMANLDSGPTQDFLFELHLSLGTMLLPLVLVRVVWRLTHTPPPLPSDIPPLQRFVASATHYLLYATLIVQPILGWIGVSAYRAPISFFGLFELPPIWREDRAFSDQIFVVHRNVAFIMAALILMHFGGAMYHQLIRQDHLLRRMWR
jgi:cytochrome b561